MDDYNTMHFCNGYYTGLGYVRPGVRQKTRRQASGVRRQASGVRRQASKERYGSLSKVQGMN